MHMKPTLKLHVDLMIARLHLQNMSLLDDTSTENRDKILRSDNDCGESEREDVIDNLDEPLTGGVIESPPSYGEQFSFKDNFFQFILKCR